MIELPEARTIAADLRKEILGKKIINLSGNFIDHKFTFYYDDPTKYKEQLVGKTVTNIIDRNFYVEIEIEDYILLMRDGANIRYYNTYNEPPKKSKLLLQFNDNSFLNVTTSMYSLIFVFKKGIDLANKYYVLEKSGISPMDKEFTFKYFKSLITSTTLKLSIKAFLATDQRILGIGNGVVQDIMFNAKLYPRRKMNTLNDDEIRNLYDSILFTLKQMIDANGRDTEKNIYGQTGNYKTILSNKTYKNSCPICKNEIKKEQYLGGSIYYCSKCQK